MNQDIALNKMKITKLIGVDRDNTIHYDRKGYFGKSSDWQSEFEFCPGAVEGLRMLSEREDIAIAVLTNQVGVAKGVLSEDRVREVNNYINEQLLARGVNINSWQYSAYSLPKGAEIWESRGIKTVDYDYVVSADSTSASLIKPGIGMFEAAALELGLDLDAVEVWGIGDKHPDVFCATNADGKGILVDNPAVGRMDNPYERIERVIEQMEEPKYKGRLFVVKNVVEAASIIGRE